MTSREPLILGMDGGGSVTTTWLALADGRVIGRGRAGPSNIKAVGSNAAMTALDISILAAFQNAGLDVGPIEASCLGLAGFDRDEDKEWLKRWAGASNWANRLILVNDGDLVVAAGTPNGWGIGLIAGTGSIAVGRSEDGRKARAGGWGFLFGDEGSAYGISVAALRRTARIADGRDGRRLDSDSLARRIFRALKINGPDELVSAVYGTGFDRARIADLSRAVVDAAAEDPNLVEELIRPAAIELAQIVAATSKQLGWNSGYLPLAIAGGLLLNCPDLCRILLERLASSGYDVEHRSVPNPVEGALAIARRGLAG